MANKIEYAHKCSPNGESFQGWWVIGYDGQPINQRPLPSKKAAQAYSILDRISEHILAHANSIEMWREETDGDSFEHAFNIVDWATRQIMNYYPCPDCGLSPTWVDPKNPKHIICSRCDLESLLS